MAAPAKTLNAIGVMLKEEATYNAGGSLSTSTDGVQLAYDSPNGAPCSYTEDFDGVRSINPGGPAALKLMAPSARVFNAALPFQFKGYGAAYASGNKSPLHALIKANGYDAAGSFVGGSEKWTFTPTAGPTGFTSLAGSLITAGEAFPFQAAFVKGWKCMMQGAKPPIHTFDIVGLLGDPADSSNATTITYPLLTVEPPKFESAVVTIGSFIIPDVVSVEWDSGRAEPSPRLLGTASGAHAGWAMSTQIAPSLTITVERTALVGSPYHTSAGLDPYNMRKLATAIATSGVSAKYGAQYNRVGFNFVQAQLAGPPVLGANGSVATWQLKFVPYTSTPIANDSHNVIMD